MDLRGRSRTAMLSLVATIGLIACDDHGTDTPVYGAPSGPYGGAGQGSAGTAGAGGQGGAGGDAGAGGK